MTTLIKRNDRPIVVDAFDSTLDLFFKNLFDNSLFTPITSAKLKYPIDIHIDDKGLNFELAVVGLNKDDISIETEGETLRVSYSKTSSEEDNGKEYVYKGIASRNFDFAWKIPTDYCLDRLEANLQNGLLTILIPVNEQRLIKKVTIK
jgi:HSP20 family protein